MNPLKILFLKIVAMVLLVPFAASPALAAKKAKTPVVNATDTKALEANLGKNVSVEGTVVSTGKGPKDGMRFINFSDTKTTGFTAALVPAVYPEFPKLEDLVGKKVRVKGALETYKKKPIIKVSHATQVKILKEKSKAAAKTEKPKTQKSAATKKKTAS